MSPSDRRGPKRRSHSRRLIFGAPRAAWISARARNAARRPVFIGAVSVGAFVTTLVALIVVPQQARRAAERVAPDPSERVDTVPMLREYERTEAQFRLADSALVAARAASSRLAQSTAEQALPADVIARRDSLTSTLLALDPLIRRAASVPLPSSYRALAASPALRDDPRVEMLLDSLAAVEQERELFGAQGGADPVFVALTSRLNEFGRGIQAIAEERRNIARRELRLLAPPAPPPTPALVATADTTPRIAARAAALAALDSARKALADARRRASTYAQREAQAQELTHFSAPPLAMLTAALVVGAALGFGAGFIDELRRPHLADADEAQRVSGLRVLGSITSQRPIEERGRRITDRLAPPYIDPGNDGHQLVYLSVAAAAPNLLILAVTGDDPAVAAVVASNFAAISADEARTTLLIDADVATRGVAGALRIRPEPGVADIVDRRTGWPEATVTVTIGRSSTFDVVPSGVAAPLPDYGELAALLRTDVARLSRRYDTIVTVLSNEHAVGGLPAELPTAKLVYCVRTGETRISDLRKTIEALRLAGVQPLGLVIWGTDSPVLTPGESTNGRQAEREQLVASRA
jgi:Mrp family chromosome partitioning ATPase